MNNFSPFGPLPSETAKLSKSSKSPKSALENPLLKASSLFVAAPSLVPENERSPKPPLPNRSQKLSHTPGPPPRTSLSLNLNLGSIPKETPSTVCRDESSGTIDLPTSSSQSHLSSTTTSNHHHQSPKGGAPINIESRNGHWVIAFGYTNDSEAQELNSILHNYGRIVSTKSSGNWLAVQFHDEVSAVRASTRQMVRVGSILCGISRANSQLLQELTTRQSVESSNLVRPSTRSLAPEISSMDEEEILAGYAKDKGNTSSARQHQTSICEKLFFWYFGWDTGANRKLHRD